MREVGELRLYRKALGYSTSDMGRILLCTRQQVSAAEKGIISPYFHKYYDMVIDQEWKKLSESEQAWRLQYVKETGNQIGLKRYFSLESCFKMRA